MVYGKFFFLNVHDLLERFYYSIVINYVMVEIDKAITLCLSMDHADKLQ